MKRFTVSFGLICLITSFAFAQAPAAVEAEFDQLYQQIMELTAANQDVPAAMEERFFELEAIVYPERQMRDRGGHLDQGSNTCEGAIVFTQPPFGTDTLMGDGGNTSYGGLTNNCPWDVCGAGIDVFYILDVSYQDDILISTCGPPGSGFNTVLCIFKEDTLTPELDCCVPSAMYARNDNHGGICEVGDTQHSAIDTCFTPGRYYICVDGRSGGSSGQYSLWIDFRYDDCIPPKPPAECPPDFLEHEEVAVADEEPCGFTNAVPCPVGVCGIVDGVGDLDVFEFQVAECSDVLISLYADSTENAPGGTAFRMGLDGLLWLYTTTCEAPISTNNDILLNGIGPLPPVGTDSQIWYGHLSPGVPYYVVVTGSNDTIGPYELTIECSPCPNGNGGNH